MTAVSIPFLQDPLFSITSEDSEHVYLSKSFMLLGGMAMLVIKAFGPLLSCAIPYLSDEANFYGPACFGPLRVKYGIQNKFNLDNLWVQMA